MYKDLGKIINKWDPVDLFPMAPEDEYKQEISDLVDICEENVEISEIELSKVIKMIFENRFGKEVIFKKNELEIAKKIISVIR